MTLPITCAMCGGQIEPDDVAFREELIVCPYCSILNRITSTGTEKSTEPIRKRQRPMGVKIEKNANDESLFYVDAGGIRLPLIVSRLLISIPVIGLILYSIGVLMYPRQFGDIESFYVFIFALVFCSGNCLFFSMFLASTFSESLSFLPPIKLTEEILYCSENENFWGRRTRVLLKDIRQIYTVFHLEQRVPPNGFLFRNLARYFSKSQLRILMNYRVASYSIYALTHSGKRIPILSRIPEQYAAEAIYVEEALELEIGLFDLPVYGDQNLPHSLETKLNATPHHKLAIKLLNCKCCGAPLPIPPSPLKGYIVCDYCRVLSLLYGAGSHKPVLGLPKLNSPESQFAITKTGKRLRIRRREAHEDALLILSKTEVGYQVLPSKSFGTLNSARIKDIFAKEVELPGSTHKIVDFSNPGQWKDELAHSGDLEKSYKRVHGTLFYQLIVKTDAGKEICILDRIKNPYEALGLAERIAYLYGLDFKG